MQTETAPQLFELKHRDKLAAVLTIVDAIAIDVPDRAALDPREVDALASNIERVGLIHQPTLMRTGKRFAVITGRRRVAALQTLAARELQTLAENGITEITAHVLDRTRFQRIECYVRSEKKTSAEDVAALVLSENAMRSANVLGELRSINVLIAAGQTPKTIAASTGQHISWIRHRVILNKLVPDAMQLFESGRMRFETAQRLARLDEATQKRSLDRFRDKSGDDATAVLSMADVLVATSKPVASLPVQMFAALPGTAPAVATGQTVRELTDVEPTFSISPAAQRVIDEAAERIDAARVITDPASSKYGVDVNAAEALAALPPADRLAVIAGQLEALVALMPDVASRDAIKRARSRVLAGRDAINGEGGAR